MAQSNVATSFHVWHARLASVNRIHLAQQLQGARSLDHASYRYWAQRVANYDGTLERFCARAIEEAR